jgi:hypothetical protein
MASVITNLLGGNLLDGVSKVIDSIKGKSPEDAAKLEQLKEQYQEEFLKAQVDLAKSQTDANVQLNSIAGQNVRADATSGDKFTARARPAIIWVGLFIMAWNYVTVPLLAIHYRIAVVAFPDMFWEIWGVVATGVVMTRTVDKAAQTLLGGSGGCATLPLGIKLESKGD